MNNKAAFLVGYNCPACKAPGGLMHARGFPTVKWTYCACGRFLRVYVAPYADTASVQTFDAPLGDDEQPEIVA